MLGQLARFLAPLVVYVFLTFLHLVLPAKWVIGYVKPKYRLNGLLVFFVAIGILGIACFCGLLPSDWLYIERWSSLIGAIVLGLIFSAVIVFAAPSKDTIHSNLTQFYLGRMENPQIGSVDIKVWLYLVGAIMLAFNTLSFAAHHYLQFSGDSVNRGIFLSAALLLFFLVDYLYFEDVHLYTYDFFAERVGFKLAWGCLAFYPYFYSIGLWYTVALPNPLQGNLEWSIWAFSVVTFFSGWILSRGANLQKFHFKRDPQKTFLGIKPVVIISPIDPTKQLLVSGFWGWSRHINYLGEILMASGQVMATGHVSSLVVWAYPLYYVALLFPRQQDDDKRCAKKYGQLWEKYRKIVPFRIIPWIY